MMKKLTAYEKVTAQIIAKIEESGQLPWHKPWRDNPNLSPVNMISGNAYKGINSFVLDGKHDTNYWLTYKQAKDLGGQVRKGEKGTQVTFMPSQDTFTMVNFDFATLERRLRELAFLNSGVRILLTDARGETPQVSELVYEGGLNAFVTYLDRKKQPVFDAPIAFSGEKDGITVEVALQWNDSYHETMLPPYIVLKDLLCRN